MLASGFLTLDEGKTKFRYAMGAGTGMRASGIRRFVRKRQT
jgi:hypothetical protein